MEMEDTQYEALAEFRYELRCFLIFSEREARLTGLTPQHHQALLAIRGNPDRSLTVGALADRLVIEPHSASGLASRLRKANLLERTHGEDRRVADLRLTERAEHLLEDLARVHMVEIRRTKKVLLNLLERFGDVSA